MASQRRRARKGGTVARWVAAALLVGSLLGSVVLILAVSAGWQREQLTRNVERILADALDVEVAIQGIEGPLYPELVLRGAVFGPPQAPIARVEALSLDWSLGALFPTLELDLEPLALDGAQVWLRRREDGTWQWPTSDGDDDSEAFIRVHVGELSIAGLRVSVDAPFDEPAWTARGRVDGAARDLILPWTDASMAALAGELELAFEPGSESALFDRGQLRAALPPAAPLELVGTAEGRAGRVELSGGVDLAAGSAQLQLAIEGFDASRFPVGVPVATSLTGTAQVEATRAHTREGEPHLAVVLDLAPSRAGNLVVTEATVRGETRGSKWTLEEVRVRGKGVALDASGSGERTSLEALALELRLESLSWLDPWLEADTGLGGRLEAAGQLEGPLGKPSGRVDIDTRHLSLRGVELGRLKARVGFIEGRRAELEELTLSGGALALHALPGAAFERVDGGVSMEGIELRGDGQALSVAGWIGPEEVRALRIAVSRADIGPWARLLSIASAPGGVVTGEARVNGPLAAPSLRGELDWKDAVWESVSLDSISAQIEANPQRIDLDAHVRDAARGRIDLKTKLRVPAKPGALESWFAHSEDTLELHGEGIDVSTLAPWLPESVGEPRGRLRLEMAATGGMTPPAFHGWLELEDGWLAIDALGETLGPATARIAVEGAQLRVEELAVGAPGERALVTGLVTLDGLQPSEVDLRLQLADFPLSRVPLPRADDEPEQDSIETGGRIDADLLLRGAIAAPSLVGKIDWTEPRWQSVVLERIHAEFDGNPDKVEGTGSAFYAGREVAHVRVSLPVPENPERPIDWLSDEEALVVVRGEKLDFALLEPFLPRDVRRPRGIADVELRIAGGQPEPDIEGSVEVENGAIHVPILRQTFAPVSGRARFDGRTVVIESLEIGTQEAGARGGGRIELVDLRPGEADLRLTLTRFPLARSPLLRSDVDGELRLAGRLDAPVLTGELSFQDTRVNVRDESDAALKEVRIATDRATGPYGVREETDTRPSVFDRAAADVSFLVPAGTWVRGSEMELDVEGRVRLEKRPFESPRLSGSMNVVRGSARLEIRRFVVRRGRATLDGGSELDPMLDVEAIYPVADIVVVAYLTGRVSAPKLRLESEPPLPQADVVSYLVLGRPANQLGASEQGSVNTAAAGLAAGLALSEVRDLLGDSFPLDTIEVQIGEGDHPTRLDVGKYVGKDLFVRYGQSFGPESEQEIGISLRLDDHWSVESSTSSNATAGADLIWSIEY